MIQAESAIGMLSLASQWGWAAGKFNLPIADGPYNGTLGFAAQPDALLDGPKDGCVTLSRASSVIKPGGKRVADYRQAIRASELPPLTIREKARIEEWKQTFM